MKRMIFTLTMLFVLGASSQVLAQIPQNAYTSLVQDGKTWNTVVVNQNDSDSGKYEEYVQYVEGDTLIGGKTWKKVFQDGGGLHDSYFAAIREEGQKVYSIVAGKDKQRLLYDFSLKVGDRVVCMAEPYGSFHCLLEPDEEYQDWGTSMELKSIDTIHVNGQELRRFVFESRYAEKSSSFSYPSLVWVEGIGSEGGLFLSWSKVTPESRVSCMLEGEVIFRDEDFHVPSETAGIMSSRMSQTFDKNDTYDLQGHRIATPQKPGVYVRNGRKYVVK